MPLRVARSKLTETFPLTPTDPSDVFFSPELKSQVLRECRKSGALVAGMALAHRINANIVHRWGREGAQSALVIATQAFVHVAQGAGRVEREG